jgi:hypothetical protein
MSPSGVCGLAAVVSRRHAASGTRAAFRVTVRTALARPHEHVHECRYYDRDGEQEHVGPRLDELPMQWADAAPESAHVAALLPPVMRFANLWSVETRDRPPLNPGFCEHFSRRGRS